MRPTRHNNPGAVLQRRQAQLRAAATGKEALEDSSNCSVMHSAESALMYSHYFPTPDVGADGVFVFEVIMFVYSMVAMCLQLLHLYRSVFWLPHSYNRNHLNWYLIEWQLFSFSGLFLGRRILWNILRTLIVWLTPSQWTQSFIIVGRSLSTLSILVSLFFLIYATMAKYPILNLLYLIYPVVVYFVLFGFSGEPYLDLIPSTSSGKMKLFKDKGGNYRTSYSIPGVAPNPDNVRLESGLMRQDFNMRLKQVAFNSFCAAYYAAFIPCTFAQAAVHYETAWVVRHIILVFIGAFSLYAGQLFPGAYVHFMHRCATNLGGWTKIQDGLQTRVSPNFYSVWQSGVFWPRGAIVRSGPGAKELFRADGVANAAEPDDGSHAKFYFLFRDVSLFSWLWLLIQSGLVLAQHVSLFLSTSWYKIISESILLFANYYALFKAVRDFFVFWRLNAAEEDLVQEICSRKKTE